MVTIKKLKIILPIVALILFVGWFFWMDYGRSQANDIESKVKAALSMAVELQQRDGDRTQIKDKSTGQTFYAPYFSDPQQQFIVLKTALYQLNTDESVPPLKLTNLNMNPFDPIDIQVTVTYSGAFGIKKSVEINTTAKRIRFKNKTGLETLH
jgi:hypothetical protein